MTNKEFLDEMLEYDRERYAFFEKYQEIAVEIFKVFHKVCTDNGLTYYLAFGSLLGALRGDGFIPWDSDIDVIFPYSDLGKLHDCLKKELPDGYYFVSERTDDSYPYYQMRICKKDYDHGIHVDVFYMYGIPDGEKEKKKYVEKVKRLFNLRRKVTDDGERSSTKARKIGKKLLSAFTSVNRMNKKLDTLCMKYPVSGSKEFSVVFHDPLIFPSEFFGTPVKYDNGGVEVLIPRQAEKFLEARYGEWKKYLPVKDRYAEFEKLYNFLLGVESRHQKTVSKQEGNEK